MTALDVHQLAAKNGYPPPESNEGHTCTQCGAPVACAFKTIAQARSVARGHVLMANALEAKLIGGRWGRQRRVEFSDADALKLLAELGSIAKVATTLGAPYNTVRDAVRRNGNGHAPSKRS